MQVIGYFNYINRVATALGVEPDEFVHPWELGAPVRHEVGAREAGGA